MDRILKIFSCNSNRDLAHKICDHIGVSLGNAEVDKFSDGEIHIQLNESVRGADVYVIQSTCEPVDQHLMELLIMVDALKRASAKTINVVIPYYGYGRQDRKTRARDPITAKLVANLLMTAGAHRMIALDLHAMQIQGFFDIPVDHLPAVPILAEHFRKKHLPDVTVVAPDHGGAIRARRLAERLGAPIAVIDKRRPAPNVAEVMNIVGDIVNKTAIIVDDIVDTGGTIMLASNALVERGAADVYVCCTHAVFSGPAMERLSSAAIKEIIITDTIPLPKQKHLDKITVISVAHIIGDAIVRIHKEESVSMLFN